MKAKVMIQVADRRLEQEEREVPRVGPDDALLRVEANGLCGSDVEQYKGHFVQKGLVEYPVIPGHEAVGVIAEMGANAAQSWGVKVGDRVALEPHLTCGKCPRCLQGNYHLCRSLLPIKQPPSYGYIPLKYGHGLWGGYSEYIHLHPRTILHKLPAELPLELSTMYQLIAAGIRWSLHVPQTTFGDTVLILGCGQRGLGAVIACANAGVKCIIVTGLERDRRKLDLARSFGAHHAIVADRENVVERVMAITAGRGADVAVDVTPSATQPVLDAISSVRNGGQVVLAGIKGGTKKVEIDTDTLVFREVSIKGLWTQGVDAYSQAIDLLARNYKRLAPMHTHEFPMEQVATAIEIMAGERPGEEAISISIHPGRAVVPEHK